MNRQMVKVQMNSQGLSSTPMATPPAAARSTNPMAIAMTSRIMRCFR